MAVKGSINHRMRIIAHRPLMRYLRFFGVLIVCAGFFFAGVFHTQRLQLVIEDDKHSAEQKMAREITELRTVADVDRQTIEEMRQLVITQKAQMAASERFLRVYKELLASGSKTNPLGVSFGVFTVFPATGNGHFTYKLVVQKLSTQEADFVGNLEFKVIGQQGGKHVELSLYEISAQATSSSIPLNLKYFQVLEGELQLPLGFIPKTVELAVKTGDRNVVETELEWPISSS